jgi:hypothetical protein
MSVIIDGSAGVTTTSGAVYNGIASGTAVASTSGTSIDFTGIPSWAKRITVMFNGVSTNGTSNYLIQLGDSGGIETTGYVCGSAAITTITGLSTSTSGFILRLFAANQSANGAARFNLLSGNTFAGEGTFYDGLGSQGIVTMAGTKILSDTLTQIRITTVNGTDTFDAGSINIMYE